MFIQTESWNVQYSVSIRPEQQLINPRGGGGVGGNNYLRNEVMLKGDLHLMK